MPDENAKHPTNVNELIDRGMEIAELVLAGQLGYRESNAAKEWYSMALRGWKLQLDAFTRANRRPEGKLLDRLDIPAVTIEPTPDA